MHLDDTSQQQVGESWDHSPQEGGGNWGFALSMLADVRGTCGWHAKQAGSKWLNKCLFAPYPKRSGMEEFKFGARGFELQK